MTQATKHMLTLDLDSIKNANELQHAVSNIENFLNKIKEIANESKREPNVRYVVNVLHGDQVETVSFDSDTMYHDTHIRKCILKLNIPEVPAEVGNIDCVQGDIGYIIDEHLSEDRPVYEILGSKFRCADQTDKRKKGAAHTWVHLTDATRIVITRLPVSDADRAAAGLAELQDIRNKYIKSKNFVDNDDRTFTFQV